LTQSDLSVTHELKVSKSNEALRLGVTLNVFNVFNQRAPITLYNAPIAVNTYVTPTLASSPLGWDYLSLMNNFDYMGLMNNKTTAIDPKTGNTIYAGPNTNGSPNTLASRYGHPVYYQDARAMRLQVKFTF
jgi:hypothetical protein